MFQVKCVNDIVYKVIKLGVRMYVQEQTVWA